MNKKKYIITSLLSFFALSNSIYATCTQEEIDYFKQIEDNYKVEYELDKNKNTYLLKFYYHDPDKHIYNFPFEDAENVWLDEENKILYINDIKPNKYKIEIKGKMKICDSVLKTINLNLKPYNKYSENPLCKGNEEFVLCQETYDKDIDDTTFVSRINSYIKEKEKNKETSKEEQKKNTTFQKIEEIYIKYKIIIVAIIMVIVIMTPLTIIFLKSYNKKRRLE